MLTLTFVATIIEWRGPAPFFFVPVPAEHVEAVRHAAKFASYGWGCIPIEAMANGSAFTTSLIPRDGGYLLPLKDAVRRPNKLTLGDEVAITLAISPREL